MNARLVLWSRPADDLSPSQLSCRLHHGDDKTSDRAGRRAGHGCADAGRAERRAAADAYRRTEDGWRWERRRREPALATATATPPDSAWLLALGVLLSVLIASLNAL
jgi:hypothetical protein